MIQKKSSNIQHQRPKLGFLYLDYVLRFFNRSNFSRWPDRIEEVTYHWGNDKQRFIDEVKRKKIDVLIGNIPATAYETFRDIARALPHVQFVPSLDAQFSNKSKENVTRFCEKYGIPVPKTRIFYDKQNGLDFLKQTRYPKIIKRSYGPSNYGGYFVHKVDSYQEAQTLMAGKKYYPLYVQDFVPMVADIRVMLVGHKPVCAFWRRPPKGEWLTNTSQGGSMDYQNVPRAVLDLAVRVSKAANAEYWACDIAVSEDGQLSILECATAFAAFPYIRDWIGQYLCWKFSAGQIAKPYIPLYNWEELGRLSSGVLRRMRHIHFDKTATISQDCGEQFFEVGDDNYPILDTDFNNREEWPSEIWNYQDKYKNQPVAVQPVLAAQAGSIEDQESPELLPVMADLQQQQHLKVSKRSRAGWISFFKQVRGIGDKMSRRIVDTLGANGVEKALTEKPEKLCEVEQLHTVKMGRIMTYWHKIRSSFN